MYKLLIDLGKNKIKINSDNFLYIQEVEECQDTVFVYLNFINELSEIIIQSNSMLVNGLCKLIAIFYQNKTYEEILSCNYINDYLSDKYNLSYKRRIGIKNIEKTIKQLSLNYLKSLNVKV